MLLCFSVSDLDMAAKTASCVRLYMLVWSLRSKTRRSADSWAWRARQAGGHVRRRIVKSPRRRRRRLLASGTCRRQEASISGGEWGQGVGERLGEVTSVINEASFDCRRLPTPAESSEWPRRLLESCVLLLFAACRSIYAGSRVLRFGDLISCSRLDKSVRTHIVVGEICASPHTALQEKGFFFICTCSFRNVKNINSNKHL